MVLLLLLAFALLVLTHLFFWNKGIDLFKKLKQHSHEFITPSSLNTFLIPKTISMFLCISDTKVYTSNLC